MSHIVKRSGDSHSEIHALLKNSIRTGEIPHGTRLKEVVVAKQFSASRTTLRQALWRLTAEGFVEFGSREGFHVRPLDDLSLRDYAETVEMVLLVGVNLAILRADTDRVDGLLEEWALHCDQSIDQPHKDWCEYFEQQVCELSQNAELVDFLLRLQALCSCARASTEVSVVAAFGPVLQAIKERKRLAVRSALSQYIGKIFGISSLGLDLRADVPRRSEIFKSDNGSVLSRSYSIIRNKLIAFAYRPGERLREQELADATGGSRPSVREALSRLVAEKLVVWEPNRGFSVRALRAKEIFDLFELRAGLETHMVGLAIERGTDKEIESFEKIWREVYKKIRNMSDSQIIQADESYHQSIALLARNRILKNGLDSIALRIHFIRGIDLRQSSTDWAEEHNQISAAIAQRNPKVAESLMHAHLDRLRDEIDAALKIGVEQLYIN